MSGAISARDLTGSITVMIHRQMPGDLMPRLIKGRRVVLIKDRRVVAGPRAIPSPIPDREWDQSADHPAVPLVRDVLQAEVTKSRIRILTRRGKGVISRTAQVLSR